MCYRCCISLLFLLNYDPHLSNEFLIYPASSHPPSNIGLLRDAYSTVHVPPPNPTLIIMGCLGLNARQCNFMGGTVKDIN